MYLIKKYTELIIPRISKFLDQIFVSSSPHLPHRQGGPGSLKDEEGARTVTQQVCLLDMIFYITLYFFRCEPLIEFCMYGWLFYTAVFTPLLVEMLYLFIQISFQHRKTVSHPPPKKNYNCYCAIAVCAIMRVYSEVVSPPQKPILLSLDVRALILNSKRFPDLFQIIYISKQNQFSDTVWRFQFSYNVWIITWRNYRLAG